MTLTLILGIWLGLVALGAAVAVGVSREEVE
jgi:hypothetical protein